MAGDLLVAEEVRRPTAGQYEVVVLDFAYRGEESLTLGCYPDDISRRKTKFFFRRKAARKGKAIELGSSPDDATW